MTQLTLDAWALAQHRRLVTRDRVRARWCREAAEATTGAHRSRPHRVEVARRAREDERAEARAAHRYGG